MTMNPIRALLLSQICRSAVVHHLVVVEAAQMTRMCANIVDALARDRRSGDVCADQRWVPQRHLRGVSWSTGLRTRRMFRRRLRRSPRDTAATYADITRSTDELLGWEPRVGHDEGLARFGAWLFPLLRGGEALRRDNAQRSRTAGAAGATRSVTSGCALKPVRDEFDFDVVWRKFDQLHREVGR